MYIQIQPLKLAQLLKSQNWIKMSDLWNLKLLSFWKYMHPVLNIK